MTPDVSLSADDRQIAYSAPDSKSNAEGKPHVQQGFDKDLCSKYDCKPNTTRQQKPCRSNLSPRLLKTRGAAEYLAISQWKLRQLVRRGELAYIDDGQGGPWRFDLHDLDAYIEQNRQRTM